MIPAVLAAGLGALGASEAHADEFHFTRSDALVERAHRIEGVVHQTHVELTVRRIVHNGGARPDQATFFIDLPAGAVATGLRTRAIVDGAPRWFDGDLLEAEEAARRYQELTGIGGYYPKDPALLSWRNQGLLALQVFPCMAHEEKHVEYTLSLPTRWEDGRVRFELPRLGTERVPAEVVLRPARSGDRLVVDEVPRGVRAALRPDQPGRLRDVELVPGQFEGEVAAVLASVPFEADRSLTHLRIDAAPRLGEVPERAAVVVLIDASRSVSPEALEAERRAAAATLEHFKGRGAEVHVALFDRKVRALTTGFVAPELAIARLGGASPERKNGSDLELALAHADAVLAKLPPSRPKRVLLFGDLKPPPRTDPEQVAPPKDAVLHFVRTRSGSAHLVRSNDQAWATAPRRTGGLTWLAAADAGAGDARVVFEELARPMRIFEARVTAAGAPDPELGAATTLDEGEGLEVTRIDSSYLAEAVFEGELWSRPLRVTVRPDAAHGRRWAALVFGSSLLSELKEPEMMKLAMYGGAVSPVTSYLAIEPGVRPSTEGLEPSESGTGQGFGAGGAGMRGVGLGGGGAYVDYAGLVRGLVEQAVRGCNPPGRVEVGVSTTLAEIVDVLAVAHGDGLDRKAALCVEEALWESELPDVFVQRVEGFYRLAI